MIPYLPIVLLWDVNTLVLPPPPQLDKFGSSQILLAAACFLFVIVVSTKVEQILAFSQKTLVEDLVYQNQAHVDFKPPCQ